MIKMIQLFTKSNCPFCVQAKTFLTQKHIPFNEIKVDEDPAAREFIVSRGHRTVPQIYLGEQLFVEGGFQGLSKLTESQIKEKLNVNQ